MTFGEKLQKLRARKSISQEHLAELLDVSRQAVSKWERDETMPETEKVVRISDYFAVTTDYLLKDGPETWPPQTGANRNLKAWYREKGYQLGWVLAAVGAFWLARLLPALWLVWGQGGWWGAATMLLGLYVWPGAGALLIGVLSALLGRRLAGRLRWHHAGWPLVCWGVLEELRFVLWELLYRFPPENVAVGGPTPLAAYSAGVVTAAIAVLAGLAVVFLGKRKT